MFRRTAQAMVAGLIGIAAIATGGFGGFDSRHTALAAMPTEAEARKIFYALIEQRTAAVENSDYSQIEPLYSHGDQLVVFRPDLVMRGWPAVQGYWQKSMSRKRTEPFRVYWNDDLKVTITGDLIVGGLTWSNQLANNPRRYGALSLALRQEGDRWRIVHEHSSNWSKPSP
jgi:ketosteroid isomerase-like protein